MCNPAWHPLWAVIGEPAGLKPAEVWGIVAALRDDELLAQLDDKGRVACLAKWSRRKPIQVALVLAGLQARGLMVDGRLTLGDGHGDAPVTVTASPAAINPLIRRETGDVSGDTRHGDAGDVDDVERLARRRAVSRKSSAKYRAKLRASADERIGYPQPISVTLHPGRPEEEKDIYPSSEDAEQATRVLKREHLWKRIQTAAPRVLAERDHRYWVEHMTPDRIERFLARGTGALHPKLRGLTERLIQATAPRGTPPPPPDPRQRNMLLPIEGALDPRQTAGMRKLGEALADYGVAMMNGARGAA